MSQTVYGERVVSKQFASKPRYNSHSSVVSRMFCDVRVSEAVGKVSRAAMLRLSRAFGQHRPDTARFFTFLAIDIHEDTRHVSRMQC